MKNSFLYKNLFLSFLLCVLFLIAFLSYVFFKKPIISVVMPTYNRADLLPRAIDSILNQTYRNFEFIIVDDGSTDNTSELLKKYRKKDNRIKILPNKKNCGISCSRNKGMDAARGQFIAPMDSDDEAIPTRLEKLLTVMNNHPQLAVIAGEWEYENTPIQKNWLKNKTTYNITIPSEKMQFELLFGSSFCNVCTLIRTSFIHSNHIRYNDQYISAEDYDFWKQVLLKNGEIAKIQEPVSLIRFHQTNTRQYYSNQRYNAVLIKKELLKRFFEPTSSELKYSYSTLEKCKLLQKISDSNKAQKILSQNEIDSFIFENCPNKDQKSFYIIHKDWEDFIIPTDTKTFWRFSDAKEGNYAIDKDKLIIKWKDETLDEFILKPDGTYAYQ